LEQEGRSATNDAKHEERESIGLNDEGSAGIAGTSRSSQPSRLRVSRRLDDAEPRRQAGEARVLFGIASLLW